MSKKFKFNNGFESTVSDKVAEILAKKGAGKVINAEPAAKPVEAKK